MVERVRIASADGHRTVDVAYDEGVFTSITPASGEAKLLMLPGFIDIHTHGADRIDVNHITGWEDVDRLSRFYASHGVTSVLLSVMTDTEDKMEELMTTLDKALSTPVGGADVMGIHLEGPFLCQEYKGAMPPELIRKPDWPFLEKLVALSGGRVKYITLAPEVEGMMDLIDQIRSHTGIVVSMGHSAADYDTAIQAIEHGVTSATHLFNAMKLFHMHRPAISGASLERDEVYCEMISDGFHLHPATVRLILKTKGWDKVVCISDSIMATGLPAGTYKLGVNDVIVGDDGDAKLVDGVRAGSTLTLDKAYRNLKVFTGADDWHLQRILATNQARLLGLADRGAIEEGLRADFCLVDENGRVVRTVVGGRTVWHR